MKFKETKDLGIREKIIADISNDIYEKSWEQIQSLILSVNNSILNEEISERELLQFFGNIFSKIFAKGMVSCESIRRTNKDTDNTFDSVIEETFDAIRMILRLKKPITKKVNENGIVTKLDIIK